MAFIPCPGVAQFNLVYSSYGNPTENVMHVHHVDNSAWTTTQLAAMESTIITWDGASAKSHRVSDFGLISIFGRDLTSAAGAESITTVLSQGTLAGPALPENCTISIKKDCGVAGRSFRGRWYWVGLAVSFMSADRYNQTECLAIVAALNALRDAVNAVANCELVVLSRFSGVNPTTHKPIPRGSGIATKMTNFSLVDNIIDNQRRRLPQHSRHG